jgi:hypothetical protein
LICLGPIWEGHLFLGSDLEVAHGRKRLLAVLKVRKTAFFQQFTLIFKPTHVVIAILLSQMGPVVVAFLLLYKELLGIGAKFKVSFEVPLPCPFEVIKDLELLFIVVRDLI